MALGSTIDLIAWWTLSNPGFGRLQVVPPSVLCDMRLGERVMKGLRIGDALAMPVHWYYDQERLLGDYGEVQRFLAPKNPHPGSILWRSSYHPPNEKGEILHEQRQYWGKRDIHYHQFLAAGESTLNAQLCRRHWELLNAEGGWDANSFLEDYIRFMTTPGMHRDTYVEECHRVFFSNYALGKSPVRCAQKEKHVGGLCFLFPLLAYYEMDYAAGREAAKARLALTHPGSLMEEGAGIVFDLWEQVCAGSTPSAAAEQVVRGQASSLLGGSWNSWLKQETRSCLARSIGTVCYLPQAIPAILYLLWKHGDDPKRCLVENTMSGGDNVHRGMVLGALLGAGEKAFVDAF